MAPIFFLIGEKNKSLNLIITIILYAIFYFIGSTELNKNILTLFDNSYATSISENISRYDNPNSLTGWGKIHIIQYAVLVFITIFHLFSYIKFKKIVYDNLKNKNLLIVSIFSFLVLIATSSNSHTFLRFLNTFSLFFIIPLIIHLINQKYSSLVFRKPLIYGYMLYMTFFSWFYFYLRVIDSDRSYGITLLNDNLLELFVTSVFGFLNHNIS